ncbi:putative RNA-dependent RNA polymerase [Pteromalus puparum negative-strand RNA virus 1]|uniref:Replicase n=1 Tax=Pteromalus puparum negative-strand RNA virus 1 TaxID=1926633 RepID=A0A1L5BWP9_9MONO|nr:putative RNA-dependent RNA polymerase [Pteromalus puparum negative-strand RNA virus 1]APL97667.1 putative RNA-dependent RNA polymerase [Pteromalus puparum negative-strand RNA virus 1]
MQHQYSRHLSGALQTDKIDFYRKYPQYVDKRFRTLKVEWFKDLNSGFVDATPVLPWLEGYVRQAIATYQHNIEDIWPIVWNTMHTSLRIQIEHLTQGLSHADPTASLRILVDLCNSKELKECGRDKIYIINVHNEITKQSERMQHSFVLSSLPQVELVGDLVVLHAFPTGPVIITYQMLVSVLDKIESKFSWLFYVLYADKVPLRAPFQTAQLFKAVYDICENAYKALGNEAIRVFKCLEPICVGVVLRLHDPRMNDHQFLNEILAAIMEKGEALHYYADQIATLLTDYLTVHGDRGAPFVLEQYGQEKLHHYPITSGELGMMKMFKYGTAYRPSSEQAIRELSADFKREYLVAYYEKHKSLPRAHTSMRMDPRIKEMYKEGRPKSLRECWKIPKAAWAELEFQQNHDFNYYPQISDLLDDKAITPDLEHIWQLFAADALDILGKVKPRQKQHTRLILEILNREVIDIREFYHRVEALGYIPKNWAVIQLMAKERELKIEARVFSILTFECRMMASACERNLGEQILPLFKQQSMTLSGAQLRQKMDVLSTLPETDTHVWIRFNMDLEQWNYTFRTFQQSFILDTLCQLFGVQHFRYMTQIFTDSLLISANKFSPPGMEGVFTHWDCHAGGNQGILQKLWTLITILVIRKVMYAQDLEHRLTGSGDNQVLFVKLEKDNQIQDRIVSIKRQLSEAFADVGLALKLEETWVSSNLTCYQRTYYLNGVKIINGLKQAGRAFSGSGDINAGINAIVTTAVNGGAGLTENQSDPVLGPAFTLLEILITLLGDVNYREVVPKDPHRLVILTFLSSDFGFLPMQQLPNYLYAGHQDTLSESLSLLRFVWERYPEYRALISGAIKFRKGDHDLESKLQLVLEPTALNISRPKLPEALIRTRVEEYLTNPAAVKNNQLKRMFDASQKTDQLRLAQELLKIRPINTSLVHSLFEYSHIGSLLGTLSRFNRISSIVKLVGMNKPDESKVCFSEQVRNLDLNNLKYFFRRIAVTNWTSQDFITEIVSVSPIEFQRFCQKHQVSPRCIFSVRLFLISFTYGLENEFITGPYTPPPSEQLVFVDNPSHCLRESDLIISPSYNIPDTLAELEESRGCYNLYIGSRTADPVRAIKLTALDGVEVGTAIKTLLKTLAWVKSTGSDQTVSDFIKEQLGSRMDGLEPLLDQLVPGTAGGNINHRFGGPGAIMWAFANSTTLISTWYMITSNRATALQRGEEDRFVFFQQLFHHIYGALRFCNPYKRKIYATIRLDHCSYLIPEARYSAPPIHMPGRDKLFGGLILDPTRKEQLVREAEHFTSVMSKSLLTLLTGEEILSAVIGQEISYSVLQHRIGGVTLEQEDHRLTNAGTDINLTVLRKVPLTRLLLSFVVHLALHGHFGPKITPHRLSRLLRRRSALGLMGQSATPLVNFLNALLTAGMIGPLLRLSGSWWDWDGGKSVISLLSPLLKGVAVCLDQWIKHPYRIVVLVEIKNSMHSYKQLIKFLKNWSPKLKKTLDQNRFLDALGQIDMVNHTNYPLRVLMVTDSGIATEYGRRVFNQETIDRLPPLTIPTTPLNPPAFQSIVGPNWFSIDTRSPALAPWHEEMLVAPEISWNPRHYLTKNFTRMTRWNCGPSMGAPKIANILETEGMVLQDKSLVITLAEGLGSYLSYILHLYPTVYGVYNSRVLPDHTPTALAGMYIPSCLLCPCDVIARVINLPETWASYGDLTQPATWQELRTVTSKSGYRVSLLTMDMEHQPGVSVDVFALVDCFIQEYHPDNCIIKTTMTAALGECEAPLRLIAQQYGESKIVKPVMSSPSSEEIFLVCKGWGPQLGSDNVNVRGAILAGIQHHEAHCKGHRLGQVLVESIASGWETQYCPGYITPSLRLSAENKGVCYAVLAPYFFQLFDLTYRRYYKGWDLDITEQIVTRSSSAQSASTGANIWAVLAAMSFYVAQFGGHLGGQGLESAMLSLEKDPGPLLELLDRREQTSPSPKAWKLTIQLLCALVAGPCADMVDTDLILLEAFMRLLRTDDRFGLVSEEQLANNDLAWSIIQKSSCWKENLGVTNLLVPGNFMVADKLLTKLMAQLGWDKCCLKCSLAEFTDLLQELPWTIPLHPSKAPVVVITMSISNDLLDIKCRNELLLIHFDFMNKIQPRSGGAWTHFTGEELDGVPLRLWYYLLSH